jgi:PAS domain S-box-containing protein
MWSEMYGFSEELLLGKNLTVFLSPAEAEINDVACSCALNSEAVKYEWSLARNEDKFYFESSLTPLYGSGNEVIGIVGVAREITDRKRSERLLLENEERYRKLVEFSPDAIILHKEGKIIFINPSAIKTIGAISSDQMVGKNIREFIHQEYLDNISQRLNILYSGKLDVLPVTEIKLIRCDGSLIDAEISTVMFSFQGDKIVQTVARDITERRKTQEALKVSENKFRTLVENIPGIVYRCEVKVPWRMTMMSEAVEQLTGYESSVFTANKLTFAEVVHPEDLQFVKNNINRAFNNHQQFDLEYRIIHKNGTIKWVHEVGKAAYNKKGNQDWLDGVIIDITAKKISEEIIKESQIILKATLESSADGVLVVDNLGNVRLHNSRFVEMWQISEELLKTNNAIIIFNAAFEQLENPEKFSAKVKELDKSIDDDFDFLFFKDGRIFERYSSSLILENKIIGRVWSFRNITDQKLAERELRKLSRAVSQSSAGIVITDINGTIEYVNPKFAEITGFTFEEAIGNNLRILKSGQHHISLYKNLWETILSGNEWRGELYNKKKSGELYWEYISISPVKNEKGELTHFVAVKEDISARKKIEFRTPLNGILGFTQLLKDELVGKDELEMLEKITRSGKRLMNTLNSVLTLTELENENYLITQSQIDLSIFCHQIKSLYEISARDKKLELCTDIKNENIQIKTDENLLTKIVSSLVENAIKYTREGSVQILLESKVSNDNKKFAIIKIKDSGIGINLENHDIIFREFKQLSEGYRRDFEGLGLGLTLARKMANLLGGDIFVESTIGIGSTFSVVLPMDNKSGIIPVKQILIEESSVSTIAYPIIPECKVLLVEDNPLNIEVVQRFLSKICNVSFARDGLSAIEMATENDYCLLMIDINLGQGMDGLEVLKQLKIMEKYATIPSIALTGYASDTNKRDFLSKGFSHYLAKPFEKRELVKLIKGILNLN